MTIWDTLTGRKSAPPPAAAAEPHDNFSPQPFDPQTAAQSTSDFLIDPSSLHPLAGLNQDTLDYLALDESVLSDLPGSQSALPSRGWSDDLCYGTGISYLSALTVGGAWGLAEGLQKNPPSMPARLRLNGVLNAVTRRGPFLGNSAGVVAMIYNGTNSTIGYWRGKHDITNSVVAGAISGAVFKSTRGLRPMAISGGIVASVAGSWALFRKVYFESEYDSGVTRRLFTSTTTFLHYYFIYATAAYSQLSAWGNSPMYIRQVLVWAGFGHASSFMQLESAGSSDEI